MMQFTSHTDPHTGEAMESDPKTLTRSLAKIKNEDEVFESTAPANGVSKVFNQETLDLLENVWGNLLIDDKGEGRGGNSQGRVKAT